MLEVFSLSALTIDAFWSPNYKIVFNFALLCLRMKESNSNFGAGCPNWAVWADLRFRFVHSTVIVNGAKLAVASVARATPLFLPFPKIIYINVLHYSAPPELIYYVQHRLYAPIGAIVYTIC